MSNDPFNGPAAAGRHVNSFGGRESLTPLEVSAFARGGR